jgi:hypothetical protein
LTSDGRLAGPLEALSPDNSHMLYLPEGTLTKDSQGKTVNRIVITEAEDVIEPSDAVIVGKAYDFTPSGIIFDRDVRITLGYDVNILSQGISSVALAYYIPESGWVELEPESGVIAGIGEISAPTNHFTVFAVLGKTTNASFRMVNMVITTSEKKYWPVLPLVIIRGKQASISFDVNNYGGQQGVYDLTIMVDGQIVDQKSLTIDPSQTEQVSFVLTDNEYGRHTIQIGELTGEFVVSWWINWWLILIIVSVLVILGWFIFRHISRKNAQKTS